MPDSGIRGSPCKLTRETEAVFKIVGGADIDEDRDRLRRAKDTSRTMAEATLCSYLLLPITLRSPLPVEKICRISDI